MVSRVKHPDGGKIEPLAVPNFRWTMRSLEYQIRHKWCLASYLILNIHFHDLDELVERELPETFATTMAKLVYAYLYEDQMPPAEIAQTVFNVTEDMLAGREVMLRAGDYIAVQKFLRKPTK